MIMKKEDLVKQESVTITKRLRCDILKIFYKLYYELKGYEVFIIIDRK